MDEVAGVSTLAGNSEFNPGWTVSEEPQGDRGGGGESCWSPKGPSPGSLRLLAEDSPGPRKGGGWLRPGEPGMSLTISLMLFLNKAAGKRHGGVGKSTGQGSRVLGLTPTPVGRGSVMWTSGFFGLGFSTWSMEPSGWRSSRRPPAPPWVCLGGPFWVPVPAP